MNGPLNLSLSVFNPCFIRGYLTFVALAGNVLIGGGRSRERTANTWTKPSFDCMSNHWEKAATWPRAPMFPARWRKGGALSRPWRSPRDQRKIAESCLEHGDPLPRRRSIRHWRFPRNSLWRRGRWRRAMTGRAKPQFPQFRSLSAWTAMMWTTDSFIGLEVFGHVLLYRRFGFTDGLATDIDPSRSRGDRPRHSGRRGSR